MSEKYLKSEARNLTEGLGSELCWGWSPAVDFCKILENIPVLEASKPNANPAATSGDADLDDCFAELGLELPAATSNAGEAATSQTPRRVLLCGSSDVRHIFHTMASLRMEEAKKGAAGRPLQFYLYEPNLRVHCRHLLFLQLICDTTMSFAELEDRVSIFMELFANSMIRDISATQLKSVTAKALRAWGYNEGVLAKLIHADEMKSKEKDFVEEQMQHWIKDTSRFPIEEQWDRRVREEMAERYDNRVNIIDWDFNFRLKDYSTQLKFPEYREWRTTGMGYDYARVNPRKGFTYDYTVPNKSLGHFNRQGFGFYTGEVKNGPFWAFGGDTANKHLTKPGFQGEIKVANGIIAMHNIRAWWYELMTGKAWPFGDHKFAWDDAKHYNYLPEGTPSEVEHTVVLPNVSFHFVGLDFERFMLRCKTNGIKFDAAFVGANSTQLLQKADFFEQMHPQGRILAETVKFVIDADEDAKSAFTNKTTSFAQERGWELNPKETGVHHANQVPAYTLESAKNDVQKKAAMHNGMPHHLILQPSKKKTTK